MITSILPPIFPWITCFRRQWAVPKKYFYTKSLLSSTIWWSLNLFDHGFLYHLLEKLQATEFSTLCTLICTQCLRLQRKWKQYQVLKMQHSLDGFHLVDPMVWSQNTRCIYVSWIKAEKWRLWRIRSQHTSCTTKCLVCCPVKCMKHG